MRQAQICETVGSSQLRLALCGSLSTAVGHAGPDFKGGKVSFLYVPADNYLLGQFTKFKSFVSSADTVKSVDVCMRS